MEELRNNEEVATGGGGIRSGIGSPPDDHDDRKRRHGGGGARRSSPENSSIDDEDDDYYDDDEFGGGDDDSGPRRRRRPLPVGLDDGGGLLTTAGMGGGDSNNGYDDCAIEPTSSYRKRRQKNNEAARKSREKRRRLDAELRRQLDLVVAENQALRHQLRLLRSTLGLPTSADLFVAADDGSPVVSTRRGRADEFWSSQSRGTAADRTYSSIGVGYGRSSTSSVDVVKVEPDDVENGDEYFEIRHPIYGRSVVVEEAVDGSSRRPADSGRRILLPVADAAGGVRDNVSSSSSSARLDGVRHYLSASGRTGNDGFVVGRQLTVTSSSSFGLPTTSRRTAAAPTQTGVDIQEPLNLTTGATGYCGSRSGPTKMVCV